MTEKCCKKREADFIICGSGPAGSALAYKLSKYYNVILLEFGKNEKHNPLINDPLKAGELVRDYTNDFFYPGGHEGSLINRNTRNPLVSGALLGGGGSVNGMQYVKSTASFFDRLVEITGDNDYNPQKAEKIYKKIEKYNPIVPSPNRGYKGPVDIRQAVRNPIEATNFVNAANNVLGIPIVNDYNLMYTEIGADVNWQLTQKPDKTRESPASAYIYPITRSNKCHDVLKDKKCKLVVKTEVFVTKVLFDGNCAIGVEAVYRGNNVVFNATKEVILSTGFQSALILQRSGVGPRKLLKDNCIHPIFINENVGHHLLNHPIVAVTASGPISNTITDPQALYDGVVFSGTSTNPSQRAYQMIGIATPLIAGNGLFTIASLMLDAKSEGFTEIISKNPAHMPLLHFGYFTDPQDRVDVVDMVNKQIQILTDPAGLNLTLISFGGNLNPTFSDIEKVYSQAYHWVGSCRISKHASDGVVDNKCRVYGVKNLRVVDSTVFPINCLGNVQAPAYYIGTLIAKKILKKYDC